MDITMTATRPQAEKQLSGFGTLVVGALVGFALLYVYVQAVLESTVRALGFSVMLTALYTMLYALLRSEDYSLLLGALLVFGVLAAVMLLTRRVDWYRSSESVGV